MVTLLAAMLCLSGSHLVLCAARADRERPRARLYPLQPEEPPMRFVGEDGDDEVPFSALSSERRRAIGRSGLRHSEQLKEAWRSGLPRLTQKRRRAHTRLQGKRATAVRDDERSEEDPFNDWFFNGRHAGEAKRPAVVAVKRVQAERHEQCNDDLDCRNSPNQVCVKRARENSGRCQCPYHQPLEVTVNGAVRCTAGSWFLNHEPARKFRELCKENLLRDFMIQHRREKAEDLLKSIIHGPNETAISFVEDVFRLSAHADPQATDEKDVRAVMRGVKRGIFGGLIRNPPTRVDAFVAEATNNERMLGARSDHCHLLSTAPVIIPAFTRRRPVL
ncbi:hypothetical protein HPB48_021589 [Haemaphysalis longicornis]|uniref:Uncharacterized protein n=1 Tax=Haemaphysalis longicornis TaxID=44386 RepID=A0A9J6FBC4_HAELO|nr:hypothetical protein HPB48_021589 [Haemaphysalis longicornis]